MIGNQLNKTFSPFNIEEGEAVLNSINVNVNNTSGLDSVILARTWESLSMEKQAELLKLFEIDML